MIFYARRTSSSFGVAPIPAKTVSRRRTVDAIISGYPRVKCLADNSECLASQGAAPYAISAGLQPSACHNQIHRPLIGQNPTHERIYAAYFNVATMNESRARAQAAASVSW